MKKELPTKKETIKRGIVIIILTIMLGAIVFIS